MSDKEEKVNFAGLKDFVAGAFGGVGLVVAGHPFLKVKVQAGEGSFLNVVKETAKRGPAAFYAGALSPLIGLALMNSVLFYSYMASVRLFRRDGDVSKLALPLVGVCGAVGGAVAALVEGPQDLFKSQIQTSQTKASGSISCAKEIISTRGLAGVLQGFSATLPRNILANAFYMGIYEMAKRKFGKGDSRNISSMQILCSGGIAGISYWVSCYPIDVIKSVIQTQPSDPALRKVNGFMGAAKYLYAEYGLAGYFRGFLPCMLRSFPANAACFFAYETVKKLIWPIGNKNVDV